MNAHAAIAKTAVTVADLQSAGTVARIERFLAGREEATPFHRPAWSLGVEEGTGQRAHYLLAEHGDQIVGVVPLTQVCSPLFGTSLVSAGFGVEGGVIATCAQVRDMLSSAAIGLAQRLACASIELRGGPVPAGWQPREGVYATFVRDLPSGEEAVLKAIPRKQRAEVRRALGNDLQIVTGRDLATHYHVYAQSVRNLGTPVFPATLFARVLARFGDHADVLTIQKHGRPVASVLSLYHRGTVYPYWGGGTAEARALRANDLLYFALMRHAAERGCTRFDFGRSKVGTGPFAYKRNWGFEPRPLTYAGWGKVRDLNPLSPRYRLQVAAWKRMPLWLANRLGPPIARGLG